MAGYAIGSAGTGIFTTVPGLILLFYLTDVLGVAAATAGAAPAAQQCSAAAARSFSTAAKLGNAVGSNPLTCSDSAKARRPNSSRSSRPES